MSSFPRLPRPVLALSAPLSEQIQNLSVHTLCPLHPSPAPSSPARTAAVPSSLASRCLPGCPAAHSPLGSLARGRVCKYKSDPVPALLRNCLWVLRVKANVLTVTYRPYPMQPCYTLSPPPSPVPPTHSTPTTLASTLFFCPRSSGYSVGGRKPALWGAGALIDKVLAEGLIPQPLRR